MMPKMNDNTVDDEIKKINISLAERSSRIRDDVSLVFSATGCPPLEGGVIIFGAKGDYDVGPQR
jgi:hypothetical protein